MSVELLLGDNGYTLTSQTKTWSADSGILIRKTYAGPIEAVHDLFEELVQTDGVVTVDDTSSEGVGKLVVSSRDDASLIQALDEKKVTETWELVGGDRYVDIRAHPTYAAAEMQDDLEVVRKAALRGDPYPDQEDEVAEDYYNLLVKGTTQYLRSSVVLRRNQSFGQEADVVASWSGVDTPCKWSDIPIPSMTKSYAILNAISQWTEFDSGKMQWLKMAPQVRYLAKGRYQITQDWLFARRWSHSLYGGDDEALNP